MNGFIDVFLNRKTRAIFLLGFASGLPTTILGASILSAWLTDGGISLTRIGWLAGLVTLPLSFKFIWAPIMDRFVPPILDRRRGWILGMQIAIAGALLALSFTRPGNSLALVAAAATLAAFFCASQDIVIDAYRTDVLEPVERGPGSAVFVSGYRVAMICATAGALFLVGHFHVSWTNIFRLTAAAMGVGILATLLAPRPPEPAPPKSLWESIGPPLGELLIRRGGIAVLLFVFLFKVPEYMAQTVTVNFMMKIGFSKPEIGAVQGGLGLFISIVGALIGGGLIARMGMIRGLLLMGILHSVSNLAFLLLAHEGARHGLMVGVIAVENLCYGLTTAGFLAFLTSRCNPKFSATQFALLTGLMALGRSASSVFSGHLADQLGWTKFFAISAAAGIPGILLLPLIRGRGKKQGNHGFTQIHTDNSKQGILSV